MCDQYPVSKMPPEPVPPPPHRPDQEYHIPQLNVTVQDLAHPGADVFFQSVSPYQALKDAVIASQKWLYHSLDDTISPPKWVFSFHYLSDIVSILHT
jgi:hypothetical protein